ncbi:MAG: hypothetical protein QM387_01265 [Spirochaetota bacterium]|nr:hypothetical protein [Spirochaetota bacterium]
MSLEENNKIDQYGVWLKKTPLLDEKEEQTEIEVEDMSENMSDDFIPIDDSFDTGKNAEVAESASLDVTEENIQDDYSDFIEQSKEDIFDEEMSSLLETETSVDQEILDTAPEDVSLETFSDGEIDLSAFMDESEKEKDNAEPSKTEEVSLDDFSDGEIDLSAFMDNDSIDSSSKSTSEEINIDDFFSGTESLHVDSFLTNEAPKEDIFEEDPIDIDLVFDDAFASEAISNPSEDIEIFYTSDSDAEFESFNVDDLFNDTEELFETEKISPQTVTYEDANEFDDLLSSLDESSPSVIDTEVTKAKKATQVYNISVRVDDDFEDKENIMEKPTEKENIENKRDETLDDIPLFLNNQKFTTKKDLEKNTSEEYTNLTRLNKEASMEFDELDDILENVEIIDGTEDTSTKKNLSEETELVIVNETNPLDEEENLDLGEKGAMDENLDIEEDDTILENAETEVAMEDSTDTSIDTDIELDETIQFNLDEDRQEINETEIFFEDEDDEISIEIDMPEDDSSEAISTDIEDALYEEKTEIEVDNKLDNDNLDSINEIDNLASMSEDFDDSLDTMESFEHFDVDSDLDLSMSIDNTLLEERNTVEKTQNTEKFLLEQIANEISSLRNEISELKKELACSTEKKVSTEADVSNGFFSGSDEDEVIALSGDELNNILINADFTEKTPLTETEISLDDDAEISLDDETEISLDDEAEISLDDDAELSLEDDAEISLDDDAEFSLDDEAEISLDDDAELSLDEETEISLDDETEISLDEEELEEEFFEENLIEPSEEELDINTIVANNEELIDTITIDSSELVVPSADSDLLEVPVDQDNDLENPEINAIADFEDELLLDVEEEDLSEIIPEAIEPDRDTEIDDENSYNEPTDEVFNSEQWGFDDDASPSLENEAKSIPATEPPATNSITKNIQDKQMQEDIKSVLVYMDQLLENLPEDKIEEFAKSENFVVYKKLFTELGLV